MQSCRRNISHRIVHPLEAYGLFAYKDGVLGRDHPPSQVLYKTLGGQVDSAFTKQSVEDHVGNVMLRGSESIALSWTSINGYPTKSPHRN
jgi:hypothetical protein